jgi:hypothetical protein
VDLTSGALLALTLQPAIEGDTTTIRKTLKEAQAPAREINAVGVEEVMADKRTYENRRRVRGERRRRSLRR